MTDTADGGARCRPEAFRRTASAGSGFTLLEVLFVVMIGVLTLGIAAQSYVSYVERTAAEHAAKIFARDLVLARSTAVRRREPVVVRFDETNRSYEVEPESGTVLVLRSYDQDADVSLSSVDLAMTGDSVVFTSRGIADLTGVSGSLAEAYFEAGQKTFTVFFNSVGRARVQAP